MKKGTVFWFTSKSSTIGDSVVEALKVLNIFVDFNGVVFLSSSADLTGEIVLLVFLTGEEVLFCCE